MRLLGTSQSRVQGVASIDGSDGSDVRPGVGVVRGGCRLGWWFRPLSGHGGIVGR